MSSITTTATAITPEIHNTTPITGFVTIFGITVNPMAIVLIAIFSAVVFMLWKGQRSGGKNTFDAWDLIMDTLPDKSRRTSGIKTAFQSAFLLSSWVIVDQEIKSTLTEGVFMAYLATWCASLIAKVVFDKQDPPKFPDPDK